ncbi:hypothetical protein FHL15_000373 [Xylaria flabelliformis]|uniref:Uncharacterized protein n=1 Tax=Xylaria flabelliformis TaxID=2512241 RepID=A0A553IFS1_9PEZI|nr:hypothetical protein FHL15_000373 [Xylaria flabelliformis]
MGLLTLFSRKSYSDLAGRDSLKTSAYDATVALEPPIRGTYPVLGNGNKILEEFQKSHPHLAPRSRKNTPAPEPLDSRPRSHDHYFPGGERPRTAPSTKPGETELPPVPKKKYGPYRLPTKIATDIQASSASARPAPSPGLTSLYSDSIRSEFSRPRGYVDLLDAQSRFKHSDFQGRLQATGARDYGEDVADRNRLEKATDSEKAKAQESHPDDEDTICAPIISKDVDDDSDDELPRRPRIRHSVSSGLRSKHTSTHTFDPYPKRTSSRLPYDADEIPKAMSRTASARSERAARRKSMPSFSASASNDSLRSSSAVRRGNEKDSDAFPDTLRDRALAATIHEREHTKPNISSKRQSLASLQVEHQTRQKRSDLEKPLPSLPPSSKDSSRRRSITQYSTLVESRLLVKRQSLQGMQSPTRGEFYEDTYQQKKSLQGAQLPRDRNSTRRQLGSTTDLQDSLYKSSAQQPDHKSHIISSSAKHTDKKRDPSQSNHLRKQSMISLSNTSIAAHEIENTVPERGSSLRHWSFTSETAMSTLSSNPFRPQSGHTNTTSTSIDFSPVFPHTHFDLSVPPVPDIPPSKSSQAMPRKPSAIPSPNTPLTTDHKHHSDEFYLEDHASNDGSTTPSRGSYEKDLLFMETDYDLSGNQISGLPGLFDAVIPVSSPSPDLSTIRAPEDGLHNVSNLLQFPAFLEFESDDSFENREQLDSSDDEMNFDIPMSRAGSALRHTLAQERLSATREPIREEDSDSDF